MISITTDLYSFDCLRRYLCCWCCKKDRDKPYIELTDTNNGGLNNVVLMRLDGNTYPEKDGK